MGEEPVGDDVAIQIRFRQHPGIRGGIVGDEAFSHVSVGEVRVAEDQLGEAVIRQRVIESDVRIPGVF